MTFRNRLFLIISLLFIANSYAGSFFGTSTQGIGLRRYTVSVRGLGMGGTGLAAPDSLSLTSYSLSKWRQINDTRLTLGLQYQRLDTELNEVNFSSAAAYVGNLNLAIPLKTHKFVLGLSLVPYSNVDFSYILTIQDQGITYDEIVSQSGSIGKAQVELIWSPHPVVGISFSGNYYFGNLKDRYRLRFNNSNYRESLHEIEYRIKGPGVGFSLDFRPHGRLDLAGFVDLEPSLDLKRIVNSPITQSDLQISNSGSFPIHFGVGSSYRVHRRLIVSADYSQQNWSEGLGIEQPPVSTEGGFISTQLDDWYQFGFGLERNAIESRREKLFDRIDLRTGFSLSGLGYKFSGEPVMQYAAHFGLGVPFSDKNRFDFAVVAGVRGSKTKNGAEERFINFEVSVAVGELWFQKLR